MVRVRHTTLVLITAAATAAVVPSTPAAAAAAVAPCVIGNGLRATALLPATAVANGYFGSASATGDFNGDGYADAAIGQYGNGKGAVNVYLGSPAGLVPQTTLTPASAVSAAAQFGAALAVGDFNGDGKDDLGVGAPGHSSSAGIVQSFTGAADGLSSARSLLITQEFAGDKTEAGDRFGSALAAGDFNGDGKDDLAIGADEEAQGSTTVRSGQVTVVRGNATNLERAWIITQSGIGQTAKAGDEFGVSLTTGQVVGDSRDDLVVGARGKDIGSDVDTGAVFVLDGAGNKTTSNPIFKGQGGSADENGDKFGTSVAIGDFNGDAKPDLAVGVPLETGATSTLQRGLVEIFPGPITKDSAGYFLSPTDQSDATANNDMFGYSLRAGDIDRDGITDLLVGAVTTPRNTLARVGAVSLFTGVRNANLRAERTIVPGDTGGTDATGLLFGGTLALGDFNQDNRTDAIIGAHGRAGNVGAAYVVGAIAPATVRTVEQYAPTAALQSPPVGARVAPIRYAYTNNVGGPQILTQTDPTNANSVVRTPDGPSEAVLTGRPVIGQTADGKGVVAFRSTVGDLWLRIETSADNTAWGPWVNYGGADLSGLSMVTLSTGRPAVFGVSSGGELLVLEQQANGAFGPWRGTGLGNLTGDPVTVAVPGGIQVFARDSAGVLRSALWNGSAVTGCVAVGGDSTIVGSPAVVVYPGSRLRVFATTPDQQLLTIGQDTAGAFEPAWAVVQATGVTGPPAAVLDRVTARVTVMARTSERRIYGATETLQGSATFGTWTEMSGQEAFTEVTAVPFTADGTDSYYFTFRNVNNAELILTPQTNGLRSSRQFAERVLPKS